MRIVCYLVVSISFIMATSKISIRPFYERIGKPRFISAPMVEHSFLPWRLLVRGSGTDLAYTQMMHAKNFNLVKKFRKEYIDWGDYCHISRDAEQERKAKELDSNTIVQFAGNDPDTLVSACKWIHEDVAAVDLNLGCPQKIAKKGFYGAYLLPDQSLVVKLLTAMVNELKCPVTAKVRVLPTVQDTLELCRAIEGCGVSMLTVHGRELTNNKNLIGPADWDIIREVKRSLSIPVIANGGISSYSDALRCLEHTGADGVMSSEALLENPKMFSEEGDRLFRTDYVRFQLQTVREFLDLVEGFGKPQQNVSSVRGHLFKMLARFFQGAGNADLLRRMAAGDVEEMRAVCVALEARMAAVGYSAELAEERGLLGATGYYLRHRNSPLRALNSSSSTGVGAMLEKYKARTSAAAVELATGGAQSCTAAAQ